MKNPQPVMRRYGKIYRKPPLHITPGVSILYLVRVTIQLVDEEKTEKDTRDEGQETPHHRGHEDFDEDYYYSQCAGQDRNDQCLRRSSAVMNELVFMRLGEM
jgi:hypothetical protein